MLKAGSSLAQTTAPPLAVPPPAANMQQVNMPVPRAISLLGDVVDVLISRNEGQDRVQTLLERQHKRSKKGPQTVDFSVLRNKLTRALGLAD